MFLHALGISALVYVGLFSLIKVGGRFIYNQLETCDQDPWRIAYMKFTYHILSKQRACLNKRTVSSDLRSFDPLIVF